ncbi:MAG: aldo/keto reductase [Acidobacteria bacterium]|nr:MAG: aldo/keto reductase [Acidobacteriota bacterium]
MDRIDLAPGYSISRLINGLWQLATDHQRRAVDRETAVRDLSRLVEAGLTTFDCADIYLGVEELLGELLQAYRVAGGRLADIQIHTKFVPDRSHLATITRQDVERSIDRSLGRLGVERLDLVQFHWWDYEMPRYIEAAGWLADLQQAGKIRLLGTTNFDVPRMRELLDAGFELVAHQAQYSLLDHRPEAGLVELCREYGLGLLCYGAIAGGFLSERYLGRGEPMAPLANRSLTKYKLIIDEFGGWELFQDLLKILVEVSQRHGVSPSSVAVRWVLERSQVAAVIVGGRTATHVDENLRVFDFSLDEEDQSRLDGPLNRALGPAGEPFGLERVPGGPHAAILKTELNRLD